MVTLGRRAYAMGGSDAGPVASSESLGPTFPDPAVRRGGGGPLRVAAAPAASRRFAGSDTLRRTRAGPAAARVRPAGAGGGEGGGGEGRLGVAVGTGPALRRQVRRVCGHHAASFYAPAATDTAEGRRGGRKRGPGRRRRMCPADGPRRRDLRPSTGRPAP